MKLIGVTGGIGSGKSVVCRMFEVLGAPVYWADRRAIELIENDTQLRREIKELLGREAYLPNGSYNRSWVAAQVFSNAELLQHLNNLVHPRVAEDRRQWQLAQTAPYGIMEAAIMNRAGDNNHLAAVVAVIAPDAERLERVLARDTHRTQQDVLNIMAKQRTNESFREIADFVITNSHTDRLIPQLLELDRQFRVIS